MAIQFMHIAKAAKECLDDAVRECRDALFLTDPAVDRETLVSEKGKRVDGTCEWIKQDGNFFADWFRDEGAISTSNTD